MKVFQGGGAIGGGGTESLLPQPTTPAPMFEFKGGGKGDPVNPFRGFTLENVLKNDALKQSALILEYVNPNGATDSFNLITEESKSGVALPVLPVIRDDSGKQFIYKKGITIGTKAPTKLFFYGVKGGILERENVNELFDKKGIKRQLVFFSEILSESTETPFMEVEGANLSKVKQFVEIIEENSPDKEKGEKEQTVKPGVTAKLSSGYRVRYVTDDIKDDIKNLKFTPMEQELFESVLHFNHGFIKKYIQASDQSKEEFFKFWQTYVNKDGTSKLMLMTNKEGIYIQDYLQNVLEAYRKELQGKTLYFLRSQDSGVSFEEYEKEKEEDSPFLGKKELFGDKGPPEKPAAGTAAGTAAAGTPPAGTAATAATAATGTPATAATATAAAEDEDKEQNDIFTNGSYNQIWEKYIEESDMTSIHPVLEGLNKIINTFDELVNYTLIKGEESVFNFTQSKYRNKISVKTFFDTINADQLSLKSEDRILNTVDLLRLLIRVRFEQIEPLYQQQFIDTLKGFAKNKREGDAIEFYIKDGFDKVNEFLKSLQRRGFKPTKPAAQRATAVPTIETIKAESNKKRKPTDEEVELYKQEIIKFGWDLKKLKLTTEKIKEKSLEDLIGFYQSVQTARAGGNPEAPTMSGGFRRTRSKTPKSVSKRQSRKSKKARS